MKIKSHSIGHGFPCLVISEIGMNHNGSIDNAKKLIDQSREAGANIVKFQLRYMDEVYAKDSLNKNNADLSTQYTIDLLTKFQLSKRDYEELFSYCDDIGIDWICTPWDKKSVDILESLQCPAYKISSADFTNTDLIGYVLRANKPLILSTGMSSESEIDYIVDKQKTKEEEYN